MTSHRCAAPWSSRTPPAAVARHRNAASRRACAARATTSTARTHAHAHATVRHRRCGSLRRGTLVNAGKRRASVVRRGKISEDDQDEDDNDSEAGAGGIEGWHGAYSFPAKFRAWTDANGEGASSDAGATTDSTNTAATTPSDASRSGKKQTKAQARAATVRELLLSRDPGLNQTLISSGTSVSQLFDQDKWERHRMVDRFVVDLISIPTSTVFLRLLKPCTALAMYTAMIVMMPALLRAAFAAAGAQVPSVFANFALQNLTLPASAHGLLGTLCGLVLVFRTNSSYARFVEGRTAWGALIRYVRDVIRLSIYIPNKAHQRRVLELCAAYAYVLKTRLRSGRTRKDPKDPTAFRDVPDEAVRRVVSEPAVANEVLQSAATGNRCLYTLMMISKTLKLALEDGTPSQIHWNIEEAVSGMGLSGGTCERIVATPIPLSFSRHTARSLVIWLITLPFVIVPTMSWYAVPTMFILTYLVLGIDEIGIQIEEPFATLPLTPLCATIERDVGIAIQEIDAPISVASTEPAVRASAPSSIVSPVSSRSQVQSV